MWLTRRLEKLRRFFTSPILTQLTNLQRRLENLITDQERQLNEALDALRREIRGAATRVIAKIEEVKSNHPEVPDLSDELNAVRDMTEQIKNIAADASPAPTSDDTPGDTPETGGGGTEGTGETPTGDGSTS